MNLICGATGDLGGAITRMLLAQGKRVRILARPWSNYQSLVEAGAELVIGDLKDRSSLDLACRGIQTIITTANSARRGGDDNPQTVDLDGNRNLIEAAKTAGVKHFIFVSALMADANSPAPFLAAKGKTEESLKASRLAYTILAPDSFMESWIAGIIGTRALSGQLVPIFNGGSRMHSFISAADVARFAVVAVDNPVAVDKKLVLGGPQPYSYMQALQVFERLLGRPVQILRLQPGDAVPSLSAEVTGMLAEMETFDSPVPMEQNVRTFGVHLTALEDFAQGLLNNGKA